jgi:Salmonella virulence plasmid 65kDa B protein
MRYFAAQVRACSIIIAALAFVIVAMRSSPQARRSPSILSVDELPASLSTNGERARIGSETTYGGPTRKAWIAACKTDKRLPRYCDSDESDVFLLSGAEDVVPILNATVDFCGYGSRRRCYKVPFHHRRPVVEIAVLQIRSAPSVSQAAYPKLRCSQEKNCCRIARCRRGDFLGFGHRWRI